MCHMILDKRFFIGLCFEASASLLFNNRYFNIYLTSWVLNVFQYGFENDFLDVYYSDLGLLFCVWNFSEKKKINSVIGFYFLLLILPMTRIFRVLQSRTVGVLYTTFEWGLTEVGRPEGQVRISLSGNFLHVFRSSLEHS